MGLRSAATGFFILYSVAFSVSAHAQQPHRLPERTRPVFTRQNAPLCPSHRALGHLMVRAYAHDINATLFDFGCLPAADGWPTIIRWEQAGMDVWAKVRVKLPTGVVRNYWTLAWELRNAPTGPMPPVAVDPAGQRSND